MFAENILPFGSMIQKILWKHLLSINVCIIDQLLLLGSMSSHCGESHLQILFNWTVSPSPSSATFPHHRKYLSNAGTCAERSFLNEIKEQHIKKILTGRDTRLGCFKKKTKP